MTDPTPTSGSSGTDLVACEFRVSGRVQGVGYRWFCRESAGSLGIRGFARNLPDGSVQVVARGRADRIESLRAALEQGPRHARVTSVERLQTAPDAPITEGFEIL